MDDLITNLDHRGRLSNRADNRRVGYYNPDNLNVIQIVTEAFNYYIENNPIESNTIGISITYVENENDTDIKSLFVIKRVYGENTNIVRVNNGQYLNDYQEINRIP